MDETLVTADTILTWIRDQVQEKRPIPPELWLNSALKLNALMSDETDRLIELEFTISQLRSDLVSEGMSSAAAKTHVESNQEFKDLRRQQEKIKQITEAIRLSKLYARVKSDELRSGI